MQKQILTIGAFALAAFMGTAQADLPPNVRCAIQAQEAARDMGSEYQTTYTRKFELCMLNAMPREQQTAYLIEKPKPYVAISPGPNQPKLTRLEEPKFTGIWVRLSPNVWVLQRN